ncbi:hypothetical protein FACS189430_03540 [Bacteroidia bacterium]|nr:hypothetical protein FACS189430_03540 [Bacteroidia bacterium]
MSSKIIIPILLIGFLSSCQNEKKYILPSILIGKTVKCETSSIRIQLNYSNLNAYYVHCTRTISDTVFFFGINDKTSSIDIFDMDNAVFKQSIKLEHEGPNGIGKDSGRGIAVRNFDSIFIFNHVAISLINREGMLIQSYSLLNRAFYQDIPFGQVTAKECSNIHVDANRQLIYMFYSPTSLNLFSKEYLDTPFLLKYDLNLRKSSLVPIHYSQYYKDSKGKLGLYMNYPNFSVCDSLIYYNFPAESNCYIYNCLTGETGVFGGTSEFTSNLTTHATGTDITKDRIHLIENAFFFNIIADPYKGLIYRLHWGGVDFKKNATEYSTEYDKPLFLTVFDKEMRKIHELRLPDHKYIPYSAFVTKKGLYLCTSNEANPEIDENLFVFDVFQFIVN